MVGEVVMDQDWRPIDEADKTKRILVHVWGHWCCAVWNHDRYSQKPRPFWSLDGQQVQTSRAHQPTRFIALPEPTHKDH